MTVKKERRKRSREESNNNAPRHGARKSLRYEGSQQETVAGGGGSKGCQSAPSPAPRPLPPVAAPSPPPPAANQPNFAGNAVIRALQQQQVVGTDAVAPTPHDEATSPPLPLPPTVLGVETLGAISNLFANDSLFGVAPFSSGDPTSIEDTSSESQGPSPVAMQPSYPAAQVQHGKENAAPGPPVRKASQAAIEAFLGTIA